MDDERAKTIIPRFWRGVRKQKSETQKNIKLCSFDTETFFGKVFALGFVVEGSPVKISYGLQADHLGFLLDQLFAIPGQGKKTIICSAHYMSFDLGVLFFQILNPLMTTRARAPRSSRFSLLSHRCEIQIFWGSPTFAKVTRDKQTIHLIDSYSFFQMSLSKALKMMGATVQKEAKPTDLGERLIPLRELLPYLSADCLGALTLLKEIRALHEKYQVRLCVSLPQLSSKIFRRYYLKNDFPIPSKPLIHASMLSYHGGKNSFVARPGWHENCYDLDINSAYPEAMAQLPDFENGKWVKGSGLKFFRAHPHGIYKISGSLKNCRYGVIFNHDFKKLSGVFNNRWATGYEINEAISSKELEISDIQGFGFLSNDRLPKQSALVRFVSDFYKLKSEAKDPALRYFYKLIGNSLYGKFIQRNDDENDDGELIKVAGGMFDPAIASLITGFVRAKIHRLEHKYNALHTATDGIITQTPPDPADLGEGIGQLKATWDYEGGKKAPAFGRVLILRNKLYLFFDRDGKMKKAGLHGFQGPKEDLEKIWKSASRIYHVDRLVKWSESWHIKIPPGKALKSVPRELILK